MGRTGGNDAAAERRLMRDGLEVLGHGALVCPGCDLPLAIPDRLAVGRTVVCGFCDHSAPARSFVREDVYDTPANEVYVVARL
jgi:hypothetical protein